MYLSKQGIDGKNQPISDKHYLTGKVDDYVPVLTMYRPLINTDINMMASKYSKKASTFNTKVLDLYNSELPIFKYMADKLYENGCLDFKEYETFLGKFESEAIDQYINDNEFDYAVCLPRGTTGRIEGYERLNQCFLEQNSWNRVSLRNRNYLTNLWFLAELNEQDISPLMSMVTKVECIPYLRLCSLLGECPDPSILEFWVREDIMEKNSIYTNLRTNFNKHIIPIIKSQTIEVVQKPSLMELFNTSKVPKFPNMVTRKQWLTEKSVDVMEHLKATKNVKSRYSIELVP